MSDAGPGDVAATYEHCAAAFDAARSRGLVERAWLQRFARTLPAGGRVLDLGCGSGRPISEWLAGQGFRVTGIDVSPAMIAIARRHAPEGDWRVGDMRALDLADSFHGIVAWDSAFHLAPDDQRALIPRLAAHLIPRGALLMTTGPDAGEVQGAIAGHPVYHASLSPGGYATLLEASGMRLTAYLADDPDCGGHTVLIARKTEEQT